MSSSSASSSQQPQQQPPSSSSSSTDPSASAASHTAPHPPLPPTFRPTFPTRSSHNYAQAEAQARSERGLHASSDALTLRRLSESQEGGEVQAGEEGKGQGQGSGGFSEQDMKRVMQDRALGGGGEGGFTEK